MIQEPIIDVNTTLGHWPTRRVPCDEPATLVAKLREQNVIETWAGSCDGLFRDDLSEVNRRLAETCRAQTSLRIVPFGSIDPSKPAWEAELQRCAETHAMPGIRLHPNYHGYRLDHPNVVRLLKAAAERKLIVQIAVLMEDARMMHPLLRVPPVDIDPLEKLVLDTPGLVLVLLNATTTANRNETLYRLLGAGNVYVEIAMLEVAPCIENLLVHVPLDQVLFGSHAPSFYFESTALKLQESQLPVSHVRAITHATARRMLPETRP